MKTGVRKTAPKKRLQRRTTRNDDQFDDTQPEVLSGRGGRRSVQSGGNDPGLPAASASRPDPLGRAWSGKRMGPQVVAIFLRPGHDAGHHPAVFSASLAVAQKIRS